MTFKMFCPFHTFYIANSKRFNSCLRSTWLFGHYMQKMTLQLHFLFYNFDKIVRKISCFIPEATQNWPLCWTIRLLFPWYSATMRHSTTKVGFIRAVFPFCST